MKFNKLALAILLLVASGCLNPPQIKRNAIQEKPSLITIKKDYEIHESSKEPETIYTNKRFLDIAVNKEDLDGMTGVELWYTKDGGENWSNHGFVEGKPDTIKFMAPTDGKYGFLKVYVDKDRHRSISPRYGTKPEMSVVVDTTPPIVELLSPNGGEVFAAGATTVVTWHAEDENLGNNPIKIEVSSDGGKNWVLVNRGLTNNGKYYWELPRSSSVSYIVKVSATDLAGNVGWDESQANFIIDGLPPEARITGPSTSSTTETDISYVAQDIGGAGVKSVKLYYTANNGGTWEYYGEDNGFSMHFKVKLLDGTYGFKLVAVDKVGNSSPIPQAGDVPQFTITIDSTPPSITLLSFNDKKGYASSFEYDILWLAKDNIAMANNAISLAYSLDNGATWTSIAEGIENTGIYKWKTPNVESDRCRLKVTAVDLLKNTQELISEPFAIESKIPQAIALSPTKNTSKTVNLDYDIQNRGASPIKIVTAWITQDNGKTWFKLGDDSKCTSPFTFTKNDGTYGLYLTCATEMGLNTGFRQSEPTEGTAPQLTLTIDSTPPVVSLISFHKGGYYKGGDVKDILWEYKDDNPSSQGLSLFYTLDGGQNWNEIASNLDPLLGKYSWTLPPRASDRCLVRIIAQDSLGNKTTVDSERIFAIATSSPTAAVTKKPAFSNSRKFDISFQTMDRMSGIAKFSIWGREATSQDRYAMLESTTNAFGDLTIQVDKDGKWDFIAVAENMAGFVNKDVAVSSLPDFSVIVDTVKPTVELKKFKTKEGRDTYLDENGFIEWVATDNVTSAQNLVIKLEYSDDAGVSWRSLDGNRIPNDGKFSSRGYLVAGKKYRLKVVAADEAGNEGSVESLDFEAVELPKIPIAVKLANFLGGETYLAGSRKVIMIDLQGDVDVSQLKVELSDKSGAEGSWTEIPMTELKAMRGGLYWKISSSKGNNFRIRVSFKDSDGKVASDMSAKDFSIMPAPKKSRISFEPLNGK